MAPTAVPDQPHVTLRKDRYGHESVVFAFPYRPDVVDAVRAIPGRRFDWEAKEWWAPRADATAPYVKGVLERHDWLTVSDDVELWLARAVTGWVGRVGTGRHDGKGGLMLRTAAGELPPELGDVATEHGSRLVLPFSKAVAEGLDQLPGARPDPRASRCIQKLMVDLDPAPATLMLTQSVGEA